MNEEQIFPKGFVDYTGFTTGRVVVLAFDSWHIQPSGQRKSKWLCQCDCGNQFVAMGANLKKPNHTTSCGCVVREKFKDYKDKLASGEWVPEKLNGQRFGRLVVQEFDRWEVLKSNKTSVWRCVCDCGNEKITRRSNLTEDSSCGCWRKEKISELQTSHGMTGNPTYVSWQKMNERCYLDSYKAKDSYQSRGIEVQDSWRHSFENFYADMGDRPEGMTLNRKNNDLGYSKDNCEWADLTQQAYNKRKGKNNTSGRVGVHKAENGSFYASISYYKKYIILIRNASFEEACRAREEAELKYYGFSKGHL